MDKLIKTKTITELLEKYMFLEHFFEMQHLDIKGNETKTIPEIFKELGSEVLRDKAIDPLQFFESLSLYIEQKLEQEKMKSAVDSLTIFAGKNKQGVQEEFGELVIKKGEIISIVGKTGSGKSRLLADIEWIAQKDTPTERQIFINGKQPDPQKRFSVSDKLVAQLSQNMNFIMDLSVEEFLILHAESRMIKNKEEIIKQILLEANFLAGESFESNTPITALSGGQSRALMIADTAFLSKSPIVLIDEIENAGVNRTKALELLLSNEKIVLMATHDPVLALMGTKRLIIKNGAIAEIIKTTEDEKKVLKELETLDVRVQGLRDDLREGRRLV